MCCGVDSGGARKSFGEKGFEEGRDRRWGVGVGGLRAEVVLFTADFEKMQPWERQVRSFVHSFLTSRADWKLTSGRGEKKR